MYSIDKSFTLSATSSTQWFSIELEIEGTEYSWELNEQRMILHCEERNDTLTRGSAVCKDGELSNIRLPKCQGKYTK